MTIEAIKPETEASDVLPAFKMREKICALEQAIKARPDSLGEDPFPLEHFFAPGLYARQITVPAGTVIVTKLHKQEHMTFVLKGRASVVTEHGAQEIPAPQVFKTPAGTKRAIYVHEETVWVTVHANPKDETDLNMLEGELIAEDYTELGLEEPVLTKVLELKKEA